MNQFEPFNQTNLFGLNKFIVELMQLYDNNKLPNKILLSGLKGLGKATLAYHFINYVLSKNEEFSYNIDEFKINSNNRSFKTIVNKSNPNLISVDINPDKKFIDIDQVRKLILNLNKSSFNKKPRFVLIDNIEFLNINSINALLKILEEPSENIYFILVNNNKKILPTLKSRCINFKIFLTNNEILDVSNKLLDGNLFELINKDLISYYLTPGNIFNLSKFAKINNYDLDTLELKDLLKLIIKDNHYKKDFLIKYLVFDLIELYFRKINYSLSSKIYDEYSYFIKRISDTKRFNLDQESLFIEFQEEVLNG
jgi:DNA polymerase III subunit delta'